MTTTIPARFVKRSVTVEAARLPEDPAQRRAVYRWVEEHVGSFTPTAPEAATSGIAIDPGTGHVLIATLEGVMIAQPGDWIIRGVRGEFYPCKHEIFQATYQHAPLPGADGETGAAIDVVAHDALGKRQRDLLWEDYPEIGEHDWAAVVERVDQITEGLIPDPHELQRAMALLASRVEDEEAGD
ncbi:hypothetical protein [Actinomyces bowdenii]|uniref:hypothetical protein n=1 Tax=Actinomyces bowdenii TaxID=131109 RepID=UPI001C54E367|nr:hypothetical protein [Actinomyces bowdenii]